MRKLIFLILCLLSFSAYAQDAPEVMNAANISRLQSVEKIDFTENLELVVGESPSNYVNLSQQATGWFNLDTSGQIISIPKSDGTIYFIENKLIFYNEPSPYRVDDLRSVHVQTNASIMASAYSNGEMLIVRIGTMSFYGGGLRQLELPIQDEVFDIWLDCPSDWYADCSLYLEMLNLEENESYILHIPAENVSEEATLIPYAPSQDPEAVVRIGRIPPPYTVTSSLEGIVKLWNLQTGETLYEVDNGTIQPSVFGAINNPPTHLVWRDNANESLYLLNFETGENRLIAELNGDYAQWFFLSPDASVILAVNLGFEPNIVAWDVATGERTILGDYRQCNRPQPDMARLSADGTTLIIGCDTGLDIWRITN